MKRVLFFLLAIFPLISFSQNEAAIWYFGQFAGLDFNSGVPVVLTDGQINTFEGCATISDFQGNLLFYTDGVTVWDRTHNMMPNGTGLLGNTSSTQSAIIVPKPNNINQYYIISVDSRGFSALSANGIRYSTVDLTLNGGLGDVIASEKNIVLVAQAYEKVTAVQHADNNSFWIIAFIEDLFLAWRVDAAGINTTPVISNVTNAPDSRGYLKISPDGNKIACANFGNTHSLMLYDFNDATGQVTNEIQLALDDANDVPYGVEFSTQSQKLYATTSQLNGNEHITPGKLVQYDLLSPTVSNSRVLIHTSNINTRGALQLAIDGKIYRALSISGTAQEGTAFLGIINDPEADGLACNYVPDALDISAGDPTRKVVEGLPPFIQSFFLTSITANDVCLGNPTQFSLSSTAIPTSVLWDFGDPSTGVDNTSSALNPTHTFSSSGIFTVTATVTIGTETTILTLDVTIYNLPIVNSPVTLIQCDDDLDGAVDFNLNEANTLISNESPAPTITYHSTENDAINSANLIANSTNHTATTGDFVWARIENAANCFATAQVFLEVTATNIPSGLMFTFNECDDNIDGDETNGITTFNFSNATTQILNALLPDTNLTVAYYENITDALAEQNSIDATNYSNTISPFTQQIVVRVDNIANDCFGLGYHVTLNVNPLPQFDLLSTVDFCSNVVNPTITIENPLSTYNYTWRNELGNSIGNTPAITVNSSGLYRVTATNTTTNCEQTKEIQVTFYTVPVVTSPVHLIQCDDDLDGIVNFNLEEANTIISNDNPLPTITYFILESDAINNMSPILNTTSFSNSTTSTVWARVENFTNCFSTAQINLEVLTTNIPTDLMISFNECDDSFDNDTTNGIAAFNFSEATNQILASLLPETDFIITYYETIENALAEQNNIDETNYRNTSPFTQQLVARADKSDGCFGLGYHVSLQVHAVPEFDLGNEITLCLNALEPIINLENPSGNYEYIWENEFGITVGDTPEIEIHTAGNYSVTATDIDGNNCQTTKTITVISAPIEPLLNFDIHNIQIVDNSDNNTITILTNNLPNNNYEFALDDEEFQLNNVYEQVSGGLHTVKIRDIENCLEAVVQISVISIPKFFTPNGDGFNETWHVTGIEFQPTSNVYIFDRFGKSIKILDPLGPGWNGLYNGNPLPSTDYWYKVELEDGRVLKGHFSLIRR
ncbi:MAG: T9SS type B sorting domain-containing protein [Lutibacter sp.]|uniref:T9SS type B sorting domain-containing protein n=1 Tax=Lutibacter sp. TaxID=1925666 RepID=UPI0019F6031E|nr:T9SS type B sorting domain-containing protein [Lutibacter sp.]NOR28360.1 T9SS type B sorting domain-containing protein [Lutibacter sp.]